MSHYVDMRNGNTVGDTTEDAATYVRDVFAMHRGVSLVSLLDASPGGAYLRFTRDGASSSFPADDWRAFFDGYMAAAMWADGPRDETTGDIDDNAPEPEGAELQRIAEHAGKWFARNYQRLKQAADCTGYGWGRAGHDYWLTRAGHGAGYWDRDELPQGLRDILTEAAGRYGGYLYAGDDGKTYADIGSDPKYRSLTAIGASVDAGALVNWHNGAYHVVRGALGQLLVVHPHITVGLNPDYDPADFH